MPNTKATKKTGSKKPQKNKSQKAKPKQSAPRLMPQAITAAPVTFSVGRFKPVFQPKPGPNGTLKLRVVDYFDQLTIGDTIDRGTLVSNVVFSPAQLKDTKVGTIASMYERYVVDRLVFHYSPALPTSVGGSLIMGFDKDPSDTVLAGENGIRHLMGLQSVSTFSPWEHCSLEVKKQNKQEFYFCRTSSDTPGGGSGSTSDGRLDYMGIFALMVMTIGQLQNGTELGDLWIETELTFYDPTWEPLQEAADNANTNNGTPHPFSVAAQQGFNDMAPNNSGASVVIRQSIIEWTSKILNGVPTWGILVNAGGSYSLADIINGISATLTSEDLFAIPFGANGAQIAETVVNYFSTPIAATTLIAAGAAGLTAMWSTILLPNLVNQVSASGGSSPASVVKWFLTPTLVGSSGTYDLRNVLITLLGSYSGRQFGIPPMSTKKHSRIGGSAESKEIPHRCQCEISGKSEIFPTSKFQPGR